MKKLISCFFHTTILSLVKSVSLTLSTLLLLAFLISTTTANAQIITTIAGTDSVGYYGDGGPADSAWLNNPTGIVIDGQGNVYISDQSNHRICKIDTAGIITTIAGTGTAGYSGDGGTATSAQFYYPSEVEVDALGNVYVVDNSNHCIRKIDTFGIIITIAGTGTGGYSGDGGAATSAQLYIPIGV